MHLAGQCGVSRGVCLIAEERVAAWLPRSGSGGGGQERVAAWLPRSASRPGCRRAGQSSGARERLLGRAALLRAVALIGGPALQRNWRGALDGLRSCGAYWPSTAGLRGPGLTGTARHARAQGLRDAARFCASRRRRAEKGEGATRGAKMRRSTQTRARRGWTAPADRDTADTHAHRPQGPAARQPSKGTATIGGRIDARARELRHRPQRPEHPAAATPARPGALGGCVK